MAHVRRRSSLVSQQRRLLRQLDSLAKTVNEIEGSVESALSKARRRQKAKAGIMAKLAQLKQRVNLGSNIKRRKRRGTKSSSLENVEAEENNDK